MTLKSAALGAPSAAQTDKPWYKQPWDAARVQPCAQQIDTKIFTGIKKIWPRRVVVDELKGLVAVFPLFVHDGTRRPVEGRPPQPGIGMVTNLVTMETIAVRGGQIHEVEAFPFVTLPYGLGDGWTPATGR